MSGHAALLATSKLTVGRASPLLRDVSFAVEAGHWWFVLGDNGAGKTTLLLTLLGVLRARGGSIARAPNVADRTGLGYVPQDLRQPTSLPLTAREVVALGLYGLPLATSSIRTRCERALAALGISDLAGTDIGRLSLGQRRRVLVARALAREPALMVLDEPTANLDPAFARALCADLDRLRLATGMALLHVAHDLELAGHFATHVALVVDGVVRAGSAASLLPQATPGVVRTEQR